MLKAYDVVVVETAVNFDFRHELLLCSTLGEGRLHDDFSGLNFLVLQVCKLVTFGETSFPEEFSLEVLLDADVSVEPDNLLFND